MGRKTQKKQGVEGKTRHCERDNCGRTNCKRETSDDAGEREPGGRVGFWRERGAFGAVELCSEDAERWERENREKGCCGKGQELEGEMQNCQNRKLRLLKGIRERVWLLAPQKPISGPSRWKGQVCYISDAGNYRGEWQTSVQRPIPRQAEGETELGEGAHAETVQSPLTVIFTESSTVVVLGTDNLYFLGARVPTSLRSVLGTVGSSRPGYSRVIV